MRGRETSRAEDLVELPDLGRTEGVRSTSTLTSSRWTSSTATITAAVVLGPTTAATRGAEQGEGDLLQWQTGMVSSCSNWIGTKTYVQWARSHKGRVSSIELSQVLT